MRTHADAMDLSDTPERRLLDSLIRARLDAPEERYAYFWGTGEGKYLPRADAEKRIEPTSGYVVDSQGRIFAFWLGWDAEQNRPALVRWRPAQPQVDWAEDDEYRTARRQVGLPS